MKNESPNLLSSLVAVLVVNMSKYLYGLHLLSAFEMAKGFYQPIYDYLKSST